MLSAIDAWPCDDVTVSGKAKTETNLQPLIERVCVCLCLSTCVCCIFVRSSPSMEWTKRLARWRLTCRSAARWSWRNPTPKPRRSSLTNEPAPWSRRLTRPQRTFFWRKKTRLSRYDVQLNHRPGLCIIIIAFRSIFQLCSSGRFRLFFSAISRTTTRNANCPKITNVFRVSRGVAMVQKGAHRKTCTCTFYEHACLETWSDNWKFNGRGNGNFANCVGFRMRWNLREKKLPSGSQSSCSS